MLVVDMRFDFRIMTICRTSSCTGAQAVQTMRQFCGGAFKLGGGVQKERQAQRERPYSGYRQHMLNVL